VLEVHNERLAEEQKRQVKAVKLAPRDIWAAETIEEAKPIVARFIQ
jgi:hypothetical protein